MLRLTAILLVLANLLYWGWTQRLMAPLGLAPAEQREPERVHNQIQPEALRLLNAPRSPAESAQGRVPPSVTTTPATSAAEPPLEPPGTRDRSQGFFTAP